MKVYKFKKKFNYIFCLAEEHPLEYNDVKASDLKNGTDGKKVEFVDVGCGYGGLLCKF